MANAPHCPVPHQKVRSHQLSVAAMAKQMHRGMSAVRNRAAGLKKVIDAPAFKKLFGDFRKQEQIKTVPQGYSADNENIDLLKLKSFVAERNYSDAELQKEGVVQKIAAVCEEIYPLNVFLKNAVS